MLMGALIPALLGSSAWSRAAAADDAGQNDDGKRARDASSITAAGQRLGELVSDEPREQADGEGDADQKKKKKKEKKPRLKIRGRVHTGWRLTSYDQPPADSDEIENTFLVRRARLKVWGKPLDWLEGVAQIDAVHLFELGRSILRDAYIDAKPLDQLAIRFGMFKKPFSGLELRSSGRLRVIERGDGNELIVEDLGYGDRDIGLMAFGRLVDDPRLDYSVGAFNGSGPYADDTGNSKDLVARMQFRPHDVIRIGANGSFKFFDDTAEGQPDMAWAVGLDTRLRLYNFRLHLEGLLAQDHLAWQQHQNDPDFETPYSLGVVGMLSQRHELPVSWRFALEPVLKVEFLDSDLNVAADDVVSFTPGLNTYFGKYFRVLINGEFRSSLRNAEQEYPSYKTLTVLACMDVQ